MAQKLFSAEEVKTIASEAVKMALADSVETTAVRKKKETAVTKKAAKATPEMPEVIVPHYEWAKANRQGVRYEGFCKVKRDGGKAYKAYVISYLVGDVADDKRVNRAFFESGFGAKKSVEILGRLE